MPTHVLRWVYDRVTASRGVIEVDTPRSAQEILLATIAHELRAPLNACVMTLNLLELKSGDPTSVATTAPVIRRNLQRLATLVSELPEFKTLLLELGAMRRQAVFANVFLENLKTLCEARLLDRLEGFKCDTGEDDQLMIDPQWADAALELLFTCLVAGQPSNTPVEVVATKDGSCVQITASGKRAESGGGAGEQGHDSGSIQRADPGASRADFRACPEVEIPKLHKLVALKLIEQMNGRVTECDGGIVIRLPLVPTT